MNPTPASPWIDTPDDREFVRRLAEAAWIALDEAMADKLAFDHNEILGAARAWLESGAKPKGPTRYVFPFG